MRLGRRAMRLFRTFSRILPFSTQHSLSLEGSKLNDKCRITFCIAHFHLRGWEILGDAAGRRKIYFVSSPSSNLLTLFSFSLPAPIPLRQLSPLSSSRPPRHSAETTLLKYELMKLQLTSLLRAVKLAHPGYQLNYIASSSGRSFVLPSGTDIKLFWRARE